MQRHRCASLRPCVRIFWIDAPKTDMYRPLCRIVETDALLHAIRFAQQMAWVFPGAIARR
jgi:hypothetical protein